MWVHALVCLLLAGAAVCYGKETNLKRLIELPTLPRHDQYYTLDEAIPTVPQIPQWEHNKAKFDIDYSINEYMLAFETHFGRHWARRKEMKWKTYENRTVYYMEIGTEGENKPVIFIESLSYATDWISTAAALYTMHVMLFNGKVMKQDEEREALKNFTLIFIPVVNPDGYEYSRTQNRLWERNRHHFNASCIGVTLDINFDYRYQKQSIFLPTKKIPCQRRMYQGTKAFSEPETRNVRDLFKQEESRLAAFVSVQAFGQQLDLPWGTDDSKKYVERLVKVGNDTMTALKTYTLHQPFENHAGAAFEWALQEKPAIYAYRLRLRPNPNDPARYQLDPREIEATGEELKTSLLLMSQGMTREGYPKPNSLMRG